MKKTRCVKFLDQLGEEWTVKFGYPGKTNGVLDDGVCRYSNRTITIRRKSEDSLLNCVAHELIHSIVPSLNEDTVTFLGELIDEVYVKMEELKNQ